MGWDGVRSMIECINMFYVVVRRTVVWKVSIIIRSVSITTGSGVLKSTETYS